MSFLLTFKSRPHVILLAAMLPIACKLLNPLSIYLSNESLQKSVDIQNNIWAIMWCDHIPDHDATSLECSDSKRTMITHHEHIHDIQRTTFLSVTLSAQAKSKL